MKRHGKQCVLVSYKLPQILHSVGHREFQVNSREMVNGRGMDRDDSNSDVRLVGEGSPKPLSLAESFRLMVERD